LVQDLNHQRFPLVEVERDVLLADQVVHHFPDGLDHLLAAHPLEVGEVEPLDQAAVDPPLDLLEIVRVTTRALRRARRLPRLARGGLLPGQSGFAGVAGGRNRHQLVASSAAPRPNSLPSGALSAASLLFFFSFTPATSRPSILMSSAYFESPFSTIGRPELIERLTPS